MAPEASDAKMMQQQMSGQLMPGGAPQVDWNVALDGERTELEITRHEFLVSQAEGRLLGGATAAKRAAGSKSKAH